MQFTHFLTSFLRDKAYGGKRLYDDMLEQALLADTLGYKGVGLPEHHLINILIMPSPLQMAVKIAALTKRVELVTAIAVLPVRDMRIFAGEVVQADMLCDGRLVLGVGRGAFAYEMGRLGSPIEQSREKFDDSLNLLLKLWAEENVEWHSDFYDFEPITIMPRPMQPIRVMLAALVPEAIYHSVRRGFHIQTTPLSGDADLLKQQVAAFHRGKAELGSVGQHLRLSLQRSVFVTKNQAEADRVIALAHDYYCRFDNVFTGPGTVSNGMIEALPRAQTQQELGKNLIICPAAEATDRLAEFAELGIDDVFVTANLGAEHQAVMDSMHRLSEDVMPHLQQQTAHSP